MQNTFSFKRIFIEKELWILVLLSIVYCYRPLFLGETFFYRDLFEHYVPQKRLFADLIRTGQLPLWDVYLHGGQPYLADPTNVALSPTSLLYLFLPLLTAFNLEIAFHLIFCAIFAYALARALGFHPRASLVTGAIFAFCGVTLSLINVLRFWAMPYIPLVLLFWHLCLVERQRKWFAATALAGAIQVFAGSPETSLLTMLFLLGWGLTYPYPQRRAFKTCLLWVVLVLFIIGLSAIQILPTAEMVRHSSRSDVDYETFTTWPLHPARLPEILFRSFLGRTDALSSADYWGKTIEGVPYTFMLSIYFGLLTTVFVIASHLEPNVLPKRIRIFLVSLCFLLSGLALGNALPFFRQFYDFMPIHWFRYPIKLLMGATLPVSLLAGSTFDAQYEISDDRKPSTSFLILLWFLTIALIAFTATFFLSGPFASMLQLLFFSDSAENIRQGLFLSFRHTCWVFTIATLLSQYQKMNPRRVHIWILSAVLVLDLFLAGRSVNPSASRELLMKTPSLAAFIQKEIADGRLFRDESPSRVELRAPSNDIVWREIWYVQTLNYYQAAYYKIPVVFHDDFDRLAPLPIMTLKRLLYSVPWERRVPLLSSAAASLVLTEEDVEVPGLRRLAVVQNASKLKFYLYRNEKAPPRAVFVTTWIYLKSGDVLRAMLSPTFNPAKHVVLEGTPGALVSHPCGLAEMKTIQSEANRTDYSVVSACDGYLVFSESYYPGWRVQVDGKQAPIERANYAFSAVFLKAGRHTVIRHFFPMSVLLGVTLSITSLVSLWLVSRKDWLLSCVYSSH